MKRLAPCLVALATLATSGAALADRLLIDTKTGALEVATEDTLEASKIQAGEANPACGTPPNSVEDIGKAMVGLGNVSVGVPLLEASKYLQIDASLVNSLRALTGTLNGKASCEQLCIELPLNATNVDAEGMVKKAGDPNWTKLEFQVESTIGQAIMERPKFAKAANGYVICSVAKNWKHDMNRTFKFRITYDKK
ncbi:exported hypothetical protein [uncultured Gammaproteobacteria bacterium]